MAESPGALERDLAFAIEAARWAGQRVLALRESGRWSGETLGDVADQAADALIQGLLRGRYPADGVLSEETRDSEERVAKERCWIVDPLDGTREFGEGRDDWAVHVALAVGGACALGAVALPAHGKLLWGSALEPRRAGIEGGGELVSGASQGPSRPRVAVSRSHTPRWIERFEREVGAGESIPAGSVGFKVSLLLLGQADVYVHRRGLKEWDTCAPETVARALGWSVCRLRGDEHRYNQPDPVCNELVVCRPAWRERVSRALAAAGALQA
jgi:3'(2'), 5'-bisphosphate nucleotidase